MKDLYKNILSTLGNLYSPEESESLARLLLEFVLGIPYHRILMKEDIPITTEKTEQIKEITQRLLQSEPIQYVLGKAYFYGLSFRVNHSTLIPRPETEELVELILSDYRRNEPSSLLDIGTGSGCIALSLAKYLPESQVLGIDISEEALEVAKENARLLTIPNCSFRQMDILSVKDVTSFPESPFDCIVSNPPYIMEKEKNAMDKNVLEYEPENALFVPDDDPLLFYRRIARLGKVLIKPNGHIYFEINAQCGVAMKMMMDEEGYKEIELIRDLSGNDRIIKALKNEE